MARLEPIEVRVKYEPIPHDPFVVIAYWMLMLLAGLTTGRFIASVV